MDDYVTKNITREQAFKQYKVQKSNARIRGIEFKLTFDEWVDFWGDDLENRGKKKYQLQMQRFNDNGAYELGNIKKDYPKQNAKTRVNVQSAKKALKAKEEHQKYLDSLMFVESKPIKDEVSEFDEHFRDKRTIKNHSFAIDKRL